MLGIILSQNGRSERLQLGADMPVIELFSKRDKPLVSADDLHRLAAALPPEYRVAVYLGGALGLRQAEVFGLRVGSIDFLRGTLTVRATVNVTFQQSKDEAALAKQNPTSGGLGGERVWTVTEGDTLGWIAYKEYGDTSLWRLIAEANRLRSVRRLTPGTVLVIPNG